MTTYLHHIWRIRHFWLALVRIDLRARYRRSILGVGWSLLHPIALTAVLCFAFSTIFGIEIESYAPFVLAGIVTWNFLAGCTAGGCQTFLQGESYIRQHPAPLAIYPLRTVLGAGIHFLLGMAVAIVLVWCLKGFINVSALWAVLPICAMLFLLGWSLATFTGMINVMFQDTQHLVDVVIQLLFYLTPVMYSADLFETRNMGWALDLNPLVAILDLVRQPILEGRIPELALYVKGLEFTTGVAAAASLVLWRLERRIIFYL